MKVEAKRVKNGFLIPLVEGMRNLKKDKIFINIEILEKKEDDIDNFFDRFAFDLKDYKFDREEANAR